MCECEREREGGREGGRERERNSVTNLRKRVVYLFLKTDDRLMYMYVVMTQSLLDATVNLILAAIELKTHYNPHNPVFVEISLHR